MQSPYQVKGLLDGLLWLKETVLNNSSELRYLKGICGNLNMYCSDYYETREYDFVADASLGWGGHSGEKYYPIKERLGLKCWEGENLEQRLSLLDHLINVVESMTNEECIIKYGLHK